MLEITEIYRSVMGESRHCGRLCAIVRLSGCHRRCCYCDSAYAFDPGNRMTIDEVLQDITALASDLVLITGGEPLLQSDVIPLMQALLDREHTVVLETSGTTGVIPLVDIPCGISRVVDIKTPGSGIAEDQIDWESIRCLDQGDELKIVCRDHRDYLWARDLIHARERLPLHTAITFSASYGELSPAELADWIVTDGLDVRFQLQMHKAIWPDRERGI